MQARADDDGAAGAFLTQRRDQAGHRIGGRANHGEVRHAGQRGHIRPDQLPADTRALGVDQPDRPFEARALEVARDHGAQAVGLVRCADQGDGGRLEEGLKVADAHKVWNDGLAKEYAAQFIVIMRNEQPLIHIKSEPFQGLQEALSAVAEKIEYSIQESRRALIVAMTFWPASSVASFGNLVDIDQANKGSGYIDCVRDSTAPSTLHCCRLVSTGVRSY